MKNDAGRIRPINWNNVPEFEKSIWNKLTENFWLPEKVAYSNDLNAWGTLTEDEKLMTMRVFAGLTLLDTIQSSVGAIALMEDADNEYQEAILANMTFMEAVHAKTYSSIFSTLANTQDIDNIFRWAEENPNLNLKADTIQKYYEGDDPLKKKIASTALEGALFYSGFYLPLKWSSLAKLTNTADAIRLIIRDEAVHAYMIGKWYQDQLLRETPERQAELKDFTYELFLDLYENEMEYTEMMYDAVGWTDGVKAFVRYNFNKALQNLGYDPLFPTSTTEVEPSILSALSPNSNENHDFFSGSGSSYVIGKKEVTEEEDWDF